VQNSTVNTPPTTLFTQNTPGVNYAYPMGITLDVNLPFPTGNLFITCQNNGSIIEASTHNIIFTDVPTEYLSYGLNTLVINDPYNLIDISFNCYCYRKGTEILTETGYKAIEEIDATQDKIVALSQIKNLYDPILQFKLEHKPIENITSFKVKKTSKGTAPICIKKDALGKDTPKRDLYVSPDHCIFLPKSKRLFQAATLVNGTTIYQDFLLRNVEYYHIELKEHSIIVAENILSESYSNQVIQRKKNRMNAKNKDTIFKNKFKTALHNR